MASLALAAQPESGSEDLDAPQGMTDEQKVARIDALGTTLVTERQKAIDARVDAGIDQRWYDDIEAYEGRDELSRNYPGLRAHVQGYVNQAPDAQKPKRSTLVVNVTRSKVNAAAARLEDIALPNDDRNWDLKESTVPELVGQLFQKNVGITHNGAPVMIQDGQTQRQVTAADLATQSIEEAKKRAKAMRDEIDDQLDLSNNGTGYEGVVRQVIDSAALCGSGIIKGPVLTSRTKKIWVPVKTSDGRTLHVLSRIQDKKPMSQWVDFWDFYPAAGCGDDIKKGGHTWERMRVTARDLRGLADLDGYLIPQIQKVLLEGPKKPGDPPQKPGIVQPTIDLNAEFELWERHGELEREDLEAVGIKVSDKDILKGYTGCVIMVNDTVIKCDIEILDTEELPYDIFTWEKCSGSWAGYGVAWLARAAQKAITAAWRVMLDNAGQVGGPQIVIKREVIEPADGDWTITGRKVWWLEGEDEDAREAFALHEISSHQQDFSNIIELGMKFLDEETSMPMLAQGEKGTAPDLVGVANILINSANTVLRKKLKNFDDNVTIPHIGRYVDWNMQYNPKEEIKGDFEVQARASGALMERDIQNQGAPQLLQLAGSPAFGYGMKKWAAVRRTVRALRFDDTDFVLPDADIEATEKRMAEAGPQLDPAVKAKNETDLAIAKMKLADAQAQRDNDQILHGREIEAKLLDYATKRQISLEKARTELAKTVISERSANARFAKEAHLRETTGAGI